MEGSMIRYVISLLVFVAAVVFVVAVSGGSVTDILDVPSFIIAGIVPFLLVSVLFGFKNMAAAFSTAVQKDAGKDRLLKAAVFFTFYGRITWIMTIIGVIIGLIPMLRYWLPEDITGLAPNISILLFLLLYGGIIYAVLILPFTLLLKKQLADKG
jgi:flagellar motor component MotA